MLETYKYLVKFTEKENLGLTNEQLVNMYKNALSENERSQAYSSLFVKNFAMLLRISNKCDFLDSSDKAGMISEELVKSIKDFDGSTKFITYLTNRVSNLFLWEYGKRKSEIKALRNSISIDELTNEHDIANTNRNVKIEDRCALEDKKQSSEFNTNVFITSINIMFEKEIAEHNSNSKSDVAYKKKLEMARKVVNLLLEDDRLVNSQIARILELYVTDKNGNYIWVEKPNAPDYRIVKYLDEDGKERLREEKITLVRKSKWYTIDKLNKFIRELFIKHNINELSC